MDNNTYPYPQFLARIANAYSSTNIDLLNTNVGQEVASAEYLNSDNESKNVRAWAEYGLDYEEIALLMPGPPSNPDTKMSDIINPDLMDMILVRIMHSSGNIVIIYYLSNFFQDF